MFYGVANAVNIGADEEDSIGNRLLHGTCNEGQGSCWEQLFGQDLLPDSVSLSVGGLGLSAEGKLTRNGDVLGGLNANIADSVANPMQMVNAMKGKVTPSVSLMFNKTLRFGRITPNQRSSIESGSSFGIGGGSIIGGQIMYVPGTRDVVISGGLTTPGVYFGGGYLHPLTNVPVTW